MGIRFFKKNIINVIPNLNPLKIFMTQAAFNAFLSAFVLFLFNNRENLKTALKL